MAILIARSPLRRQVRDRLVSSFTRGIPAPGSGINEAELAAELGVSRTPLREALHALEREGLVGSQPGRGFFVRPLSRREAQELYPIIWTLESLALRSAALRPASDFDALDALNAELRAADADADQALVLDARWHRGLVEPCDNRRLLETLESLKLQAFRYEYAFMKDAGRVFQSVEQHEAITASLRSGHLAAALEMLERNWRISLDFLSPWLEQAGHE
ncbi:MAG: GntR family transcriptional regulator [Candidatus Eisenbacteria bacterium]|uniref:GntR family transcriptional regulator n=1 Tax=Eiseniibacteriota bacterium TaxID=2212470 RepID=A0A849SFX4_UNCEI|nr:GntR family transcriptional regulator [Candidatus Eisenbacteria bacterium]